MESINHIKVGDILEGNFASLPELLILKQLKKSRDKNRQEWQVMALNKSFSGQTTTFRQKTLVKYTKKILRNDKILL